MTKDDLMDRLERELMTLSTEFESANYNDAIDDAKAETGWSLPLSASFKTKWIKDRAKRHLFFMLIGVKADDFKYKQINLEQPFEHFRSLIKDMDEAFMTAIEENPEEFSDVSASLLFGTKIDAGFQYDPVTGDDTTYTDNNEVIFNPTEND